MPCCEQRSRRSGSGAAAPLGPSVLVRCLRGPSARASLSRSSDPPRLYFLCALGLEFELLL